MAVALSLLIHYGNADYYWQSIGAKMCQIVVLNAALPYSSLMFEHTCSSTPLPLAEILASKLVITDTFVAFSLQTKCIVVKAAAGAPRVATLAHFWWCTSSAPHTFIAAPHTARVCNESCWSTFLCTFPCVSPNSQWVGRKERERKRKRPILNNNGTAAETTTRADRQQQQQ